MTRKKKKKKKKKTGATSRTLAASEAPGWDAIDAALRAEHGDVEPLHWALDLPAALGGRDPLDGISAYRVHGPPRHWHLVTYGFSELFAKETDDPATSGFGFELTVRLPRGARERRPPVWVLSFLQNLGRYVFRTGNGFAPGHHMNLNGPIVLGSDTAIRAAAFVEDPRLGSIDTPNGRLRFLQVVGLTLDELQAGQAWDTAKLLEVLAGRDPLLVTDVGRASLLDDARLRRRVEAGTRRDGSSQDGTFVNGLSWARRGKRTTIRLGAVTITNIVSLLRGRTLFGREFFVDGPDHGLLVRPARGKPSCKQEGSLLVLRLDEDSARELADALEPKRGEHRLARLPGVTVEVFPTEITDADGKVVDVVG